MRKSDNTSTLEDTHNFFCSKTWGGSSDKAPTNDSFDLWSWQSPKHYSNQVACKDECAASALAE